MPQALGSAVLADCYSALAEVFSPAQEREIPKWFSLSAKDWPLYSLATQMGVHFTSPAIAKALVEMAKTKPVSPNSRWREYEDLYFSPSGPGIWLYESQHLDGRIAGPSTFSIKRVFDQVGLEVTSSELADHVSLELAFLAFIAGKEAANTEESNIWKSARSLFIQNHASKWLPQVAKQLVNSSYSSWAAVGFLLEAALDPSPKKAPSQKIGKVPALLDLTSCDLCGFCAQVCPTQALAMFEDAQSTALMLNASLCIHCNKCVPICPQRILTLTSTETSSSLSKLRSSPRVKCPKCGDAHVSQAELESVGSQIGHPDWLYLCLPCKARGFPSNSN